MEKGQHSKLAITRSGNARGNGGKLTTEDRNR